LREESSLLLKEGEPGLMKSLLFEPLTTLRGSFTTLIYFVEDLIDNFFESDEEEAVFECRITLRRMKKIAEICERFGRFDDFTEEIFWLETATAYTGEKYVRFVISPLDIAPMMREAVFEKHPTVIFTSATLTVNGSFVYWKSRLGLSREALERSFPSPFDYRNRVLLGIPTDAPLPSEADFQSYASDFIRDVLEISEGRALVLFTSYSMLNATFVAVQPALSSLGISVLRQGDEDRNRLLVRFREETASVLFATDSFWEGVDAPGEALEVLVLCRLPFRVPTEPIFRARTEAVTAGGGNAFLELALPDTAIKLKQGFGRLMRRGGDYGIVLILDSRIVKRSYGEYLLRSLPETARSIKERKYLLEDIENFLVSARKSAG
ncbi:MAG TPA: helicase C-terminal domain-containing protein, partial [Spirochaetia bacterium]|nr:helicase C-terminal domain-containing protein [Spirochaetia bacterium]